MEAAPSGDRLAPPADQLLGSLLEDCIGVLDSLDQALLPQQERRVTSGALRGELRGIRHQAGVAFADVGVQAHVPLVPVTDAGEQCGPSMADRLHRATTLERDRVVARAGWEQAEEAYREVRQRHAKQVRELTLAIEPIRAENERLAASGDVAWGLVLGATATTAEIAQADLMRAERREAELLASNLAELQAELEDPKVDLEARFADELAALPT